MARRASGLRLLRRALLLLLGCVGLALIALKPSLQKDLDTTTAHISTPYDKSSTDDADNFDSVHDFLNADIAKETKEVHIHGIGLSADELALLGDYDLQFHPADTIVGIREIELPKITEREQWTLRGKFQDQVQDQGSGVTNIELTAPDGTTTDATISGSNFTIRSTAPAAGSYVYDIAVHTSSDTITERLPIQVTHEPSWSMLVLSSYPSFEINYLKNYWTSLGNSFALRSQISTGKYSTSFSNAKKKDLNTLTKSTVRSFDFIITDRTSWNQLSKSERTNIQSTVINQGLALIFRAEASNTQARGSVTDIQLPTLSSAEKLAWNTSQDDVDLLEYNTTSSWRSARLQGHTLSKFRSSGLGHIATLTIDDTYKLILADESKQYQDLWSSIFSNLYRDFSPTSKLIHNNWIWANEPTLITILSNERLENPPVLNDSTNLYFTTTPFITGISEAEVSPNNGLNKILLNNSQELSFYAHEVGSWPAVKQSQRLEINQQAAESSISLESNSSVLEYREISLYWWYAMVLLGFGGLWLDERVVG